MIDGALNRAEVYTDVQGLSELRRSARDNSPEALKAAAQQFEALFTQMMLKSMRDASDSIDNGDLFENDQTALYRDMYDKQLSLELSHGKGLGIADLLMRQLQGTVGKTKEAGAAKQGSAPVNPLASLPTVQPKSAPTTVSAARVEKAKDPVAFDSPEEFIHSLWPAAERAGKKLGVEPRALIAQAALETGWGKAVIRRPDGSSSYNLFNIKADDRWSGDRAIKSTLEYRDGIARQEKAPFRAYGSYEQSFEDYVSFLQSQPRYKEALSNANNPAAFIRGLQQAGYATDPNYAGKVEDILARDMLTQNEALKNWRGRTIG